MRRKDFFHGVLAGGLAMAIIFGGIQGLSGIISGNGVLSDPAHVRKIRELEHLIDAYYLEEKDEEALAEGVYTGLIYGLGDPYSQYYTAEQYEEKKSSTEGAYVGIGAVVTKNDAGGLLILECHEGGPGKQAGLMEGDIITAINGADVADEDLTDAVSRIRESADGEVALTVSRDGEKRSLEIKVPVTDVQIPTVYHEMLDGETGYIQILEFTGVTCEQYEAAFHDLDEQGMTRLIVDLRDNPGGLLNSACDILNEILPKGLIVYEEDKYGKRREEWADGKKPLNMPLVVLVNEYSASASEIFAGAIQDYGIGTIVGETTYGKGVVQSLLTLGDGSAVKLTTSYYYTPNGRSIHGSGIQPDVEVEQAGASDGGEISREKDAQLQKALRILRESP